MWLEVMLAVAMRAKPMIMKVTLKMRSCGRFILGGRTSRKVTWKKVPAANAWTKALVSVPICRPINSPAICPAGTVLATTSPALAATMELCSMAAAFRATATVTSVLCMYTPTTSHTSLIASSLQLGYFFSCMASWNRGCSFSCVL